MDHEEPVCKYPFSALLLAAWVPNISSCTKGEKIHLAGTASTSGRRKSALGLKADGKCAQVHWFPNCQEADEDPWHWKSSYYQQVQFPQGRWITPCNGSLFLQFYRIASAQMHLNLTLQEFHQGPLFTSSVCNSCIKQKTYISSCYLRPHVVKKFVLRPIKYWHCH